MKGFIWAWNRLVYQGFIGYFLYETLFQTEKQHSIQTHVVPRFWSMGLFENRLRQNPVVYHVPCENLCFFFLPMNSWAFGGYLSFRYTHPISRAATGQRLWDLVKSAAVPARLLKAVRRQGMAGTGKYLEIPHGVRSVNYLVNIQQKLRKSPCSMGKLPISMAIFNSIVKLPEGMNQVTKWLSQWIEWSYLIISEVGTLPIYANE